VEFLLTRFLHHRVAPSSVSCYKQQASDRQHDTLQFPAGVPHADGEDGADPWRDGGEQQVLPLRPLPLRPGGGEDL
jgi:hypothetical protein